LDIGKSSKKFSKEEIARIANAFPKPSGWESLKNLYFKITHRPCLSLWEANLAYYLLTTFGELLDRKSVTLDEFTGLRPVFASFCFDFLDPKLTRRQKKEVSRVEHFGQSFLYDSTFVSLEKLAGADWFKIDVRN